MLHLCLAPVITFLLLIQFVAADKDGFIQRWFHPQTGGRPGRFDLNEQWPLGSDQIVKWNTSLANYSITLWQQDRVKHSAKPGKVLFMKASDESIANNFTWKVDPGEFDITNSPVFFFGLDFGVQKGGFCSYYFNITNEDEDQTPALNIPKTSTSSAPVRVGTGGPLSVSTTILSSTSSTFTSTSTSISTTSSTAVPSSPSNDKHTALNVGLGLGIPISLLLAGAGLFILFRRKPNFNPFNRKHNRYSHPPLGGPEPFAGPEPHFPVTETSYRAYQPSLHLGDQTPRPRSAAPAYQYPPDSLAGVEAIPSIGPEPAPRYSSVAGPRDGQRGLYSPVMVQERDAVHESPFHESVAAALAGKRGASARLM